MGLNETYKGLWVGKHLSDMFPIKNGLKDGDAVSHCSLTLVMFVLLGGFR